MHDHHRPYSRRRLPAPLSSNLFNPVRLEEGTNLRATISFVGRVGEGERRTNLFKPNTGYRVHNLSSPPLSSNDLRLAALSASIRSPFVDVRHPPPRQPPATGPENSISDYRQSPSTLDPPPPFHPLRVKASKLHSNARLLVTAISESISSACTSCAYEKSTRGLSQGGGNVVCG